jgi:two-component system LytT family response regulator
MTMISAIIIDDETLARNIIREYLELHPYVNILAECRDGFQAIESIEKYHPDLLFLDIQMPEMNGFEMLDMLEEMPYVIFSTAYDQYALKAFEINAVDYLLKPYVQSRFDLAVQRAREHILKGQYDNQKIERLLKSLHDEQTYLKRMLIKESGKIIIINTTEIQWIEAVEDYVNIHTSKSTYLVLQSLSRLETKLDPKQFIRAHRSYIINLEAVGELEPWSNGRLKCRLKDGHDIILSRSGARRLKGLMV